MASIQYDGTEILSAAYMPQFVKHETVADRSVIALAQARDDGDIFISERYGKKIVRLQGTLVAADQATLDANIDSFKELFSRPEKNLDVSWGASTMRFVATCTSHAFDRDHYHTNAVPWTAEFTVSSGVGKDTSTTTAAAAVAVDTTRPVVMTRSTGATTAVDTLSHAITMPTGIIAGELLIITFSVDGIPTCTASAGWTKLSQTSDGTNAVTQAIFWKVAEGSDTCTVTTSASEQSTHVVLRIANAGTPTGTATSGNSTNSNPPSHTVSIAGIYMWIATRGGDAQVVATVAPASFSNLQTSTAAGANGASTNTAEFLLDVSPAFAEDPNTFTSATEQWVSYTIGVPPRNFFAFDSDQQFTLAGSAIPQPTVTLTLSGTPDVSMRGFQYTDMDTGERIIINRNVDMSGLSGKSIVIDFANKKVTDNLSTTDQVEGSFVGIFPRLKIGTNSVRIQTGGFINQATNDYADTTPALGATGLTSFQTIFMAQSFQVPYADETFGGLVVGLAKTGAPGNFTWAIKGDNGGVPDYGGATIASGTLGSGFVPLYPNPAYLYVPASAIFSLSANTKYWIVFSGAGQSGGNNFWAYGYVRPTLNYDNAPYTYVKYSSDSGSTWAGTLADFNLSFRLLMGGSPKATTFTHTVAYTKTYL